jgi:hypothetical protein
MLIDHARARGCGKRGGGADRVTLSDVLLVTSGPSLDLIALDRALEDRRSWTGARPR